MTLMVINLPPEYNGSTKSDCRVAPLRSRCRRLSGIHYVRSLISKWASECVIVLMSMLFKPGKTPWEWCSRTSARSAEKYSSVSDCVFCTSGIRWMQTNLAGTCVVYITRANIVAYHSKPLLSTREKARVLYIKGQGSVFQLSGWLTAWWQCRFLTPSTGWM